MCLNDGAPVEPALCDQEAMPAADGKAKSFIIQIGIPPRGIIGGILKGKTELVLLMSNQIWEPVFLPAADGKPKSFIL